MVGPLRWVCGTYTCLVLRELTLRHGMKSRGMGIHMWRPIDSLCSTCTGSRPLHPPNATCAAGCGQQLLQVLDRTQPSAPLPPTPLAVRSRSDFEAHAGGHVRRLYCLQRPPAGAGGPTHVSGWPLLPAAHVMLLVCSKCLPKTWALKRHQHLLRQPPCPERYCQRSAAGSRGFPSSDDRPFCS